MLTDLALSAMTDVLLACFQAFAAGLLFQADMRRGSPAWLWAWTMTFTALTFLVGAVDHGFYEPVAHPLHPLLMSINRALVAVVSLLFVMTAARQLLGRTGGRIAVTVAAPTAAAVAVAVFLSDNFFIVIGGYSAALLFVLALNLFALRDGGGSLAMIAGIVITFAASAIPLTGGEGLAGLGLYATYHIALMPAVVAFYLAGRTLHKAPPDLSS